MNFLQSWADHMLWFQAKFLIKKIVSIFWKYSLESKDLGWKIEICLLGGPAGGMTPSRTPPLSRRYAPWMKPLASYVWSIIWSIRRALQNPLATPLLGVALCMPKGPPCPPPMNPPLREYINHVECISSKKKFKKYRKTQILKWNSTYNVGMNNWTLF